MATANIKFISIMIFYAILSSVIGPLIFYFIGHKSLKSAGNGFILFSIITILLWYYKGRKMI